MKKITNVKDLRRKIEKDLKDSLGRWAAEYNEEVDRVITTEGIFPAFPDSDIVLSGRLRDSKQIDAKGLEISFLWNPINPDNGFAYAPAVWSGFFAFGKYYVAGRQWDIFTLENFAPLDIIVTAELALKGYNVRIKRTP